MNLKKPWMYVALFLTFLLAGTASAAEAEAASFDTATSLLDTEIFANSTNNSRRDRAERRRDNDRRRDRAERRRDRNRRGDEYGDHTPRRRDRYEDRRDRRRRDRYEDRRRRNDRRHDRYSRRYWTCVAEDRGWEEHWRAHKAKGYNYERVRRRALRECRDYHGRCYVSCDYNWSWY